MPDRRQFLAAGAALALAACTDRPTSIPMGATLPAGSVTNPTGSVNGNSLTGLQDAYTGHFGGILCPVGAAMAQWNHAVLLSNAADACGTGNPFMGGELTVRVVLVGYNELPDCAPVYPPAADLPLTFTVPAVNLDTSDGVHRLVRVYFNKAKANGSGGSDIEATSGTVTFTRADNVQFEGSVDLTFPSGGSFSGSFVAPWCGTAP